MSRVSAPPPTVGFLLGLPRSGTTLLAHLLQQHPDVLAPPEPWLMLAIESLGAVNQHHPAEPFLIGAATDEFFARIDRTAACRALANAAYGQYLAAAGKRCFIDKTPRYWMLVDFISRLYPEALQIVLLRNPYAIAASLKSSWNVALAPDHCPPARAPYLADLVLGLPALAARRLRPKTHVVRYETLVERPAEEVRRVITALGYDPAGVTSTRTGNTEYLRSSTFGDRKILEKDTVDAGSVDAWRTVLSVAEMQAVTDMIGAELLSELSYGPELQWACNAGVADRGADVTRRHREVFEAWRALRSDRKVGASAGAGNNAGQRSEAAHNLLSSCDPAVARDARLLAESETERALRLANTTISQLQQALAISEADRTAALVDIQERDATIATLSADLEQSQAALATSEADRVAGLDAIHARDGEIVKLGADLTQLRDAHMALEADSAARRDLICQHEHTIATLGGNFEQLQTAYTALRADYAVRQQVIHQHESALACLKASLGQSQAELASLETDRLAQVEIIAELETTMRLLQIERRRLEAITIELNAALVTMLGSRWWKFGRRLKIAPSAELPPQNERMLLGDPPDDRRESSRSRN